MCGKKSLFIWIVLLVISGLISTLGQHKMADLVLINGKIVTVDESKPEAQALAIKKDRILAIGTDKDIKKYISNLTQVIDLKGKLAIPGFIDSHAHFTSIGDAKMKLDLMKVKNWDHIIEIVKAAVKKVKPGEWIRGRGWHQEKWDQPPNPNVDGLPFHHTLSQISPKNPVILTHASGHSCFANAKAMELAGITRNTKDPDGGEIVRDKKGNPTGIFRETAQDLVKQVLYDYRSKRKSEEKKNEKRREIELATRECLSKGITSLHDAGTSFETIELYKKLVKENRMGIRLNVMIKEPNNRLKEHISKYKIIGMGNQHLTVRSIKRLIDGALGSHGAWLLKPYNSLPTSVGLNTESIDAMKETAKIAIDNGFQLATHAIGDRANREILDIYEAAFKANPHEKKLRWRIEHAQHFHPIDISRVGKLGIIASMQAIHCTSDGPWVFKRLGKKRAKEGAYVWQKLMKTGALICNGTDAPVEDVNPIACFYASVTRRLKDGTIFFPDQRMTREEALRSYTINGAYASFEEDIKGSLTPGKLADITILSKDIMTVPEEEILNARVLYTIVGGKIMYKK